LKIVTRVKESFRTKLRKRAIDNAKKRLWVEGLQIPDLLPHEYETIIKEEEDKIISDMKIKGSLSVALSALGLNLFW